MLELYLDSADIRAIRQLADVLPLAGVTTNPSILTANAIGVRPLLTELSDLLAPHSRFHVQVLGETTEQIIAEARELHALPWNIVVKIPAHRAGLAAIKQLKAHSQQPILATAIYNVQQGFAAALNGADYLAPYLNRIDNLGQEGMRVVADLQTLLNQYQLPTQLLVASFKNVQQVLQVLKLGVGAVTLPIEIAQQWLITPETDRAVARFNQDWQNHFGFTTAAKT